MAAINSHRKRQVYHHGISRRSYGGSGNSAPSGAATMMPDKSMSCDSYYVGRRAFAEIPEMLNRKYIGNTLNTETKKDPYTGAYLTRDLLQTNPGGMVNHSASHNPMRYHYSNSNSLHPMCYATELSGVASILNYSRAKTGLLLNSYTSYKKVGTQYQHVMALGDHQGGNIKSRATTFKWFGGMWRAK